MNFIMEVIGYPLGWIMWLGYQITNNFVVSLFIFTLIAKFLMLPMSLKQQRNTAHMYLIKPKIERIQKMYAKNQAKLQEETQKVYNEEGYSPFGGCLVVASIPRRLRADSR